MHIPLWTTLRWRLLHRRHRSSVHGEFGRLITADHIGGSGRTAIMADDF